MKNFKLMQYYNNSSSMKEPNYYPPMTTATEMAMAVRAIESWREAG
jgi:hypothetical protein